MGVTASEGQNLRCQVLSQPRFECGAIGVDDFAHTCNLSGCRCGATSVVASHQHMHVSTNSGGGGDGVQSSALDRRVVVFCNNEGCHVGNSCVCVLK
jgi:hypothetical protein